MPPEARFVDSPVGAIPLDWQAVRLGDHAEIRARIGWRGLSSSEYTNTGPYLIAGKHLDDGRIRWDECDHLSQARYEESYEIALKEGDVILSKDGTIGRVGLVDALPGPATINGTMMLVRPVAHFGRFLFYYLQGQHFQDLVRDRVSGSSVPHIFQRDLVNMWAPLPPLAEQEKIAAILCSVDDAIRATQAVIDQTRRIKEGLLQDLLTRGIGHTKYRDSELGKVPEAWDVVSLQSLLLDGPRNGAYKPPAEIGEGALIVGQTAINEDRVVDFAATRRARATAAELARYGLAAGDILVTRVYATPDGCGRAAFVEAVPEPAIYESNMMRLRVDHARFHPKLAFLWLQSPTARRYLMARASSSNQTSINQGTLGNLPCVLPPPDEQAALVERFEACERCVLSCRLERDTLLALKAGVLQDLLSGRVRAPV